MSNVDSQASFDNIVIQVIGETSNKAGDPKKFVQTFVLAQQPSGYFVLNDILRYIDEESEDEPAEAAREKEAVAQEPPAAATTESKEDSAAPAALPTNEGSTPAFDAGVIDEKLEEVTKETTAEDNTKTQPPAETPAPAVEATAKPEAEQVPDPDATAREVAEESAKEVEKPADPSPTPVQTRQPPPATASAPAPAPAPAQPPKPMTWASRAAAAAGPRPVVPLPKTATQPRPAAPAQPAAVQPAAPSAQAAEPSAPAVPPKDAPTEWQTAGGDSKRQNRPQSISGPQDEKEGKMGYVKYVTEKVKSEDLKAALAQHGDLSYFDVNRQKVNSRVSLLSEDITLIIH